VKIEFEPQDIETIAQRVVELIRPLLIKGQHGEGEDTILDKETLSQYLGVPHWWIYKQVSLKNIPHFKTGKYLKFKKSKIDKWIDNQTTNPIPPLRIAKNSR